VLVSDRLDRQGNGAGQYPERVSAPLSEPSRHPPEEHLVIGVLIHDRRVAVRVRDNRVVASLHKLPIRHDELVKVISSQIFLAVAADRVQWALDITTKTFPLDWAEAVIGATIAIPSARRALLVFKKEIWLLSLVIDSGVPRSRGARRQAGGARRAFD
jgi:hypothetical protein